MMAIHSDASIIRQPAFGEYTTYSTAEEAKEANASALWIMLKGRVRAVDLRQKRKPKRRRP